MSFKDKAKAHQLKYFKTANQSKIDKREGRAQAHWLNNTIAKKGRNFYADPYYNVFESAKQSRGKKTNTPEWFYDILRSQHIPFNFFVPLEKESNLSKAIWKKLLGINIKQIKEVKIEYPPQAKNPLGDKTSFDAFILYTNSKEEKGILGIEIKYTEGGYSPTNTEKKLINNPESIYYKTTTNSKMYRKSSYDDLKLNMNRQIWRNHLLAFAYAKKNKIENFHSVTLYHEGNTHFIKAFKKYDSFLTDKGSESLKSITFQEYCAAINKKATTKKQKDWVEYLINRYNVNR